MKHIYILIVVCFISTSSFSQEQITAIATNSYSCAPSSYNNLLGAGLVRTTGVLASRWDSTGTNFTVNYGSTANNINRITQFTVSAHPRSFVPYPVGGSMVKVRRVPNSYITDTRNYFSFWTLGTSPAPAATSGTFDLVAPEITDPESELISNNINSGYDNVFQNTHVNLHANNVERVDYIMPTGLVPKLQLDLDGGGTIVLDRGTGDDFKIAAILSVDASNIPLTYGPLITISAAQFGPNLRGASVDHCILVHDPIYGSASRPSTTINQNLRGVFVSLTTLGIALNQRFYGYSLFGTDVTTADPDWTTYPIDTYSAVQLDPANVMGIFKDVGSLLPTTITLKLSKQNDKPLLQYALYNETPNQVIAVERSFNGHDFAEINRQLLLRAGTYSFVDPQPLTGTVYYRIKVTDQIGAHWYSETKSIQLNQKDNEMQLWSNPAKDVLTVIPPQSWRQKTITLTLFNAAGVKLLEQICTANGPQKVSLEKIKKGTYFLCLTTDEMETTIKQVMVVK